MQQASDRALFANQLRGVAVIAVLIVHWCGVYWFSRDVVAAYIHAPVVEGPSSSMIYWLTIPTFNYGPFGVSIFFLISGFVIPFSLNRLEPVKFLIARFLRIYPTYVAASLIMLALVYMSSRYWGQPFSMALDRLFANLFLLQGNLHYPSIDMVNWTLAIEIKFYIIAALLYRSIKAGNAMPLILLAVAVLAACEAFPTMLAGWNLRVGLVESLESVLMGVVCMFIGSGVYHHYTGTYTARQLLAYTAILMLLFLLCWPHTNWDVQMPSVPQNYVYGFVLFSVSYMMRRYFRPFAPLDFIANISYSIYVTHSIIGYLSLRILMDQGLSFPLSGLLTLIFVLTLAYVLYRLVEVPTMHLGKRIFARKANPAPVPSAG